MQIVETDEEAPVTYFSRSEWSVRYAAPEKTISNLPRSPPKGSSSPSGVFSDNRPDEASQVSSTPSLSRLRANKGRFGYWVTSVIYFKSISSAESAGFMRRPYATKYQSKIFNEFMATWDQFTDQARSLSLTRTIRAGMFQLDPACGWLSELASRIRHDSASNSLIECVEYSGVFCSACGHSGYGLILYQLNVHILAPIEWTQIYYWTAHV